MVKKLSWLAIPLLLLTAADPPAIVNPQGGSSILPDSGYSVTSLTLPDGTTVTGPGLGALVLTAVDGGTVQIPDETANYYGYFLMTGGNFTVGNTNSSGQVKFANGDGTLGFFNNSGMISEGAVYAGTQLQTADGEIAEVDGSATEPMQFYHTTSQTGTYAYEFYKDNGSTMIASITPDGGFNAVTVQISASTVITNDCLCTQGGCSMASTTTCTCACAACTSSSICFSQPYSSAATTDAVGVQAQCSAGTVTLTAKAGTTGTETFNVECKN